MTAFGKKWLTGLVTGALMAVSAGSLAAEQKTLHVYNWSDLYCAGYGGEF